MTNIASNIKQLRKFKKLSQKEVALSIDIAQGQYSRIESGKVVPTIPTLEKIAKLFEVSLSDLVKENTDTENVNVPLLEKVKLIDQLEQEEKSALLKIIDIALSKKKFKDNLSNLLTA